MREMTTEQTTTANNRNNHHDDQNTGNNEAHQNNQTTPNQARVVKLIRELYRIQKRQKKIIRELNRLTQDADEGEESEEDPPGIDWIYPGQSQETQTRTGEE